MIDLEKNCDILEKIASNYPEASEEHEAIKLAATALHFAWQIEIQERFQTFLHNMNRELTEEERRHLINMGIIDDQGSLVGLG